MVLQQSKKLANDKYDEAVDVSQSMDQGPMSASKGINPNKGSDAKITARADEDGAKGMSKQSENSKSQSILNKPFDEALEFSQSGSDDSVDTRGENSPAEKKTTKLEIIRGDDPKAAPVATIADSKAIASSSQVHAPSPNTTNKSRDSVDDDEDEDEDEDEDGKCNCIGIGACSMSKI